MKHNKSLVPTDIVSPVNGSEKPFKKDRFLLNLNIKNKHNIAGVTKNKGC